MQNIKRLDDKPYMTIGIIVVNIIVFVLMSLSGSTLDAQYMAAHGAMYLKLHAQFPMALLFRPELQIPPADFPAPEMHILLS